MAYKILINGFGRIGKLATRLAWYDHKKVFNSEAPTGIWGTTASQVKMDRRSRLYATT